MGDRTNASLTIYACPPERVNDVLDLIEYYDLGEDWGEWDNKHKALAIGYTYVANEVNCGFASEAAGKLIEMGDVAFGASEEGYADWLGSSHQHIPGVGDFQPECDNNGNAVWSATEIMAAFDDGVFDDGNTAEEFLGITFGKKLAALLPEGYEYKNDITKYPTLPRTEES